MWHGNEDETTHQEIDLYKKKGFLPIVEHTEDLDTQTMVIFTNRPGKKLGQK